MKRMLTLIVCAVLLTGTLFSQEQVKAPAPAKSRMTFDFFGAYSMATGKYTANDLEQDNAGFAGGGFMAQIKLSWLGKKDFGLGVSYAFQQNAILKQVQDSIVPGGDPNGLGDKPWNNHYLLAGPVMVKEFNRIVLDVSVFVGFVIASSHVFDMMVPVDSVQYSISSGAGIGFAFQARAGVGYRVSNRIILTASISYLGGSPTRKKENFVYSVIEDPPGSGIYVPVYQGYEDIIKKKISTFNPGIGIMIKL
jgi:opacity protein-like surface antigen